MLRLKVTELDARFFLRFVDPLYDIAELLRHIDKRVFGRLIVFVKFLKLLVEQNVFEKNAKVFNRHLFLRLRHGALHEFGQALRHLARKDLRPRGLFDRNGHVCRRFALQRRRSRRRLVFDRFAGRRRHVLLSVSRRGFRQAVGLFRGKFLRKLRRGGRKRFRHIRYFIQRDGIRIKHLRHLLGARLFARV